MNEYAELTTKQDVKLELTKKLIEQGLLAPAIVESVNILTENIFKNSSDVKAERDELHKQANVKAV